VNSWIISGGRLQVRHRPRIGFRDINSPQGRLRRVKCLGRRSLSEAAKDRTRSAKAIAPELQGSQDRGEGGESGISMTVAPRERLARAVAGDAPPGLGACAGGWRHRPSESRQGRPSLPASQCLAGPWARDLRQFGRRQSFLFAQACAIFPANRRSMRRSSRRIGMGRSGCRRKIRIARLRRIVREGARLAVSVASMAAGVALLGCAIGGISLAIAGPAAGGLKEGRSSGGWVPVAALVGGGELRAAQEKWEPRGQARICRNWCEKDGGACLYVCKTADR
jgi:hypothetical protein